MARDTSALGNRQGPGRRPASGRTLAPSRPGGPRRRRKTEMADLAYALLLIGGFAVLVLALRGLQRL
jgi:hypothetical protein